jgi:hypothetical protein
MNPNLIEIERLAVAFRTAPASPGHNSADTWNLIEKIGGRTAIVYGMFLATPFQQRWKKTDYGLNVASALEAIIAATEKRTTAEALAAFERLKGDK